MKKIAEMTDAELQEVPGADAGVGAQAESEPAATVQTDGLEAAESHLSKFDEDATLLWSMRGPKKGRIESIGMFLVTPRGNPPAKLIAVGMKSGAFQIYAPADLQAPEAE